MERKKKPTNWSQTPEGKARQSRIRQRNLVEAERSIADDKRRMAENKKQMIDDVGNAIGGISTVTSLPGFVRGAGKMAAGLAGKVVGKKAATQGAKTATKQAAKTAATQSAKPTVTKGTEKAVARLARQKAKNPTPSTQASQSYKNMIDEDYLIQQMEKKAQQRALEYQAEKQAAKAIKDSRAVRNPLELNSRIKPK